MSLKIYYDFISQPCRALHILLNKIKYNYSPQPIDLLKGEQYSPNFTALNRLHKVPVINHNGFVLTESVAIIKYLGRQNIIPANLYPKDVELQARVDEFLEWQHIGVRLPCAMYFRVKVLNEILTGEVSDPVRIQSYEHRMSSALEMFDSQWLGRGHQFVTGDSITIADLLAACELEQPRMADYDASDKYANIGTWWNKVQQYFNPHYQHTHDMFRKLKAKHDVTSLNHAIEVLYGAQYIYKFRGKAIGARPLPWYNISPIERCPCVKGDRY